MPWDQVKGTAQNRCVRSSVILCFHVTHILVSYSTYLWVGSGGRATQTLTLFKAKFKTIPIFDISSTHLTLNNTLFETRIEYLLIVYLDSPKIAKTVQCGQVY